MNAVETHGQESPDEVFYNQVYDLLVAVGGANSRDRNDFMHSHAHSRQVNEYRFIGHLGFGGKYWRKTNTVNCYNEDETPERVALRQELNASLERLARRLGRHFE
jgi:hypothetical protein